MAQRVCSHCTGLHSQNAGFRIPKTDFIKQPDMTCSPAPTYLANSTLETYSQADKKPDSKADSMADLRDSPAVLSPRPAASPATATPSASKEPHRIREGGRAEPEPVGFHVHAGKGAVSGPGHQSLSVGCNGGEHHGHTTEGSSQRSARRDALGTRRLIFTPRHARRHGSDDCSSGRPSHFRFGLCRRTGREFAAGHDGFSVAF